MQKDIQRQIVSDPELSPILDFSTGCKPNLKIIHYKDEANVSMRVRERYRKTA
jgi:hypothetical protein